MARSHPSEIVSLPHASARSVQTKSPAFLPSAATPVETGVIERQERDSYSVTAMADITDRSLHAALARFTGGLSPAALGSAYLDWAVHLAGAPGKRMRLFDKAVRKSIRFANYATRCALEGGRSEPCIEPLSQDRRFAGENWQTWPFNFISQAFLLQQQWWHNATVGVRGVSKQHEDMLAFGSRQLLDMIAPSNFLWTNPEVLERTIITGGLNVIMGMQHFLEDWGARRQRQKAGWYRAPRGWQRRRDHSGKGRLPQRAYRVDPVRPGHRERAARTDPDRPSLDHEILHS
jgi:polyhydroxyalkanoate synthase